MAYIENSGLDLCWTEAGHVPRYLLPKQCPVVVDRLTGAAEDVRQTCGDGTVAVRRYSENTHGRNDGRRV